MMSGLAYKLLRESGAGARPILFFLHGYGSNEDDLAPLARLISPDITIISLRAPLRLGEESFGWFALTVSEGKIIHDGKGALSSRTLLAESVREMSAKFHADPSRVFLLGFSQGAILSLALALTEPNLLRGVVALSGRILPEVKELTGEKPRVGETEIFIGHGTEDTVVPIARGRSAHAYLSGKGFSVAYHEYDIGHSISPRETSDLAEWLNGALK